MRTPDSKVGITNENLIDELNAAVIEGFGATKLMESVSHTTFSESIVAPLIIPNKDTPTILVRDPTGIAHPKKGGIIMIRNFLCWIGFHKWNSWSIKYPQRRGAVRRVRDCSHCLITQRRPLC